MRTTLIGSVQEPDHDDARVESYRHSSRSPSSSRRRPPSVCRGLDGAKLAHREEGVIRGFFAELISAIVPVDERIAERAAELRSERRSLKMPDALILATADLGDGVDRIVCADDIGERIEEVLDCEVVRLAPAAQPGGP